MLLRRDISGCCRPVNTATQTQKTDIGAREPQP